MKVTTDGDADTAWTLRFINQSSDRLLVSRSSGPLAGLEAGASATLDSTSSVETFVIRSQEDQAKAVMLICGFETFTDTVTCAGLATA